MKSILTTLAVVGLATAQSATPASSSKIPSSISQGCSTFLTNLNSASGVHSCVKPVIDALATGETSALTSVCSAISSQACSDTMFRTWLTDFKSNCGPEITSNKDVMALYDSLYVIKPFGNAICSKDDSGDFCLKQLQSSGPAKSGLKNVGQTPLTSSDGTPDAQAFTNANILWLGANPDMDSAALCTTCTKNVLTSYIAWESSTPPAAGIASSPLLSSQAPLWASVQKTCPSNFISGALANANADPSTTINGASSSSPAMSAAFMLTLVAAGITAW